MIFLIFEGCNKNEIIQIEKCENLTQEDRVYYYNGSKYNGVCQVFEIDILIQENFIKEGKKYKEIGYFFPSGNIQYEGFLKNDSLTGQYRQYHENGEIRLKGKFYKGFPDGRWKTYDNRGLKLSVQIFNKGELLNTIMN